MFVSVPPPPPTPSHLISYDRNDDILLWLNRLQPRRKFVFSNMERLLATFQTSVVRMLLVRFYLKEAYEYDKKVAEHGSHWKENSCLTKDFKNMVVDKGCFAVYTMDKRHFVIPLAFLNNNVFHELLRM